MTAAEVLAPPTHGFNGWQLLLVLVLLGVVCWLWAGALAEHRERLDRLADPTPMAEDRWPL